MKLFLTSILLFLWANKGVDGLECAQCQSYKSKADCEEREVFKTCDSKYDRCITMHYQVLSTKLWMKGCTMHSVCSPLKSCASGYLHCEVNCCSKNKCNGSNHLKSSALWVLAGIASVIVYLQSV